MSSTPPSKRLKLEDNDCPDPAAIRRQRATFLSSVSRAISPPPSLRAPPEPHGTASLSTSRITDNTTKSPVNVEEPNEVEIGGQSATIADSSVRTSTTSFVSSPFQLTQIRDLPPSHNVNTLSLNVLLGNPLIKEAWIFNFCFDIDWMMTHFDPDVRDLVQVKVIHGSWKKEDSNRIHIEDACKRWSNVEAFSAYLPDPFGTHHSKMFILFTHDDNAEIIIHTANMLEKDWTNMTQALWHSGPLEKMKRADDTPLGPIGSGSRFKHDLLAYLKHYKRPTQSLCQKLQEYDFAAVRGALVASVPSQIKDALRVSSTEQHLWGYPQLREVVTALRIEKSKTKTMEPTPAKPHLICQVSSIATLPAGWLDQFRNAGIGSGASPKDISIIYPTPSNVAQSLDGYMAGGSIHTKAQTDTHLRQINAMRQQLSQWAQGPLPSSQSGRHLAAPHIKTYINFKEKPTKDNPKPDIEWALLTSANLSTQAWGSLPRLAKGVKDKSEGKVHIQSFEIGVLVWPRLFADDFSAKPRQDAANSSSARMVPVFGQDVPEGDGRMIQESGFIVGLRMPYDLPLIPYGPTELPWSPQNRYSTPDSHGNTWGIG